MDVPRHWQLLQDFAVLFCRVVARGDEDRVALVKSIAADRRLGLLPPCEVPSCSNDIAANDPCRTIALGAHLREMARAQAFPPQTARAACEAMLENMHAAGALEKQQHAAGDQPYDFCLDAVRLSSEALATLTSLRADARHRIVVRAQAYCRGVLTRKHLFARGASSVTCGSRAPRAPRRRPAVLHAADGAAPGLAGGGAGASVGPAAAGHPQQPQRPAGGHKGPQATNSRCNKRKVNENLHGN